LFILGVFVALLNFLTPSGRIVVGARVVEVTPNVSGQVVAIPVKPKQLVKGGTVLFQIDPTPFKLKVQQLEASLAEANLKASQLKASYQQATANVEGLTAQLAFNTKRLADISTLSRQQALSEFREQDTQVQAETVRYQLEAAKAAQANAKLALDAEIGGENPTVAQITAQLDNAKWELGQTTVRALADGYATTVALTIGDRATQFKPIMSFVVADELMIIGLFSPNGFQTIKPGAAVSLVFDDDPGRRYSAKILEIPRGVGQGQIATSGTLANANVLGGARQYPAVISLPEGIDRASLRLGMPGNATVYAENAGVIGLIAFILFWISSYTAYL
jgi:multidrug resistance efflux pump